jgi:hypothetical protein
MALHCMAMRCALHAGICHARFFARLVPFVTLYCYAVCVFVTRPQVKNPMTMTEKILAKHSDNANVVPGQVRGCTRTHQQQHLRSSSSSSSISTADMSTALIQPHMSLNLYVVPGQVRGCTHSLPEPQSYSPNTRTPSSSTCSHRAAALGVCKLVIPQYCTGFELRQSCAAAVAAVLPLLA